MNPSDGSDRPNTGNAVREQGITFDALNIGPMVGDLNADPSATEAGIDAEELKQHQKEVRRETAKSRKRIIKFSAIGLLLVIGIAVLFLHNDVAQKALNSNHEDASQRYAATSIPLGNLENNSAALSVENANSLSINGQLNVNNSIVLAPTKKPSGAVTGQLFYNQTTNELNYYDGKEFTTLLNGNQKILSGLGGASGNVATGSGIAVSNNTLRNTGVLTLQGENGNVTLTGGPGIAVSGTTLSNSGVLSLGGQGGSIALGSGLSLSGHTLNAQGGVQSISGGTANVTITDQGNGNWSIAVGGAGSATVASGGGVPGTFAYFAGSQDIENSLMTQSGSTVTVGGDLTVTGSLSLGGPLSVNNGGTGGNNAATARGSLGAAASGANGDITSLSGLTTALSVSQGGTGVGILPTNSVLVGNGTSALSGVAAGSAGLCLVSTNGAPSFQTCPGSGGVASINALTGALTLAGTSGGSVTSAAGTITINDATNAVKGLASFNGSNFTVTGGNVNTVQNIGTGATPSFTGLNLSTALTTGNGGTGATTAAGARTNLGAAASGINSDITSITGLTTALAVSQGGIGLNALTANELLYASSTSAVGQLSAGSSGQCLVSNGAGLAPSFQACTGAGGVSSLDTLTGSITLDNSIGAAGHVTINNAKADGATKGIAAFNSTNFSDNGAGVVNTIQGIATTSTPTFAGLNLTAALTIGNGGTGSATAAGARTNLGAAASGANNDITSITGLTTALAVTQGGTGLSALSAFGILYASSTSAVSQLGVGTSGQCLVSNGGGGAPSFQTCTGAGGVSSLDALTGVITLDNSSGAAGHVTINNAAADGTTKGIATFNSTNFSAASGVINTIQNISVSSSPTFGQLSLSSSQANNPMFTINNTNALATGNLIDLQLNGSSKLSVSPAGNLSLSGTVNGQTIGSTSSFTGGVNVAGTLGVNTITPTGALTVGVGSQSFTLQGNASSLLKATSGANTTTVDFQSPTANVTYNFATAVAGSYDICTTAGNCAGTGGGVTSGSSTVNNLAKFTASGVIGNSIISDDGSTATIAGTLSVNTITPSAALTVGSASQNLTLQGAAVSITDKAGSTTNSLVFSTPSGTGKTITLPNASGTVAVSATGPIALDAAGNLTCPTCLTSGGGGGTAGVTSVNSATGNITLQGTDAASITTVGSTITINDASSTVKGLASFNSTDLTVTSGAVDTVQSIAVTATPTFAGLNLTSALTVSNGGTGSTTAAGARTNIGAAKSGANSDITSLSGLTTALSVLQGGTGAASLTANGVLIGNGTSPVSSVTGSNGQCLVVVAGTPAFQSCPGAGGVSSVDGLTGALTINNSTGTGSAVTINNAKADGLTEGIATFNSTNFTDNGSGVINTIQDIATTSSPTFNSLNLTNALGVGSGGTGATTVAGARTSLSAAKSGSNSDITQLTGLTTALTVSQGGTGLAALSAYGILYASAANTIGQLGLGASGQCLTSNGNGAAPTWQTCAGAGGVSSLDTLTGSITLDNSSGAAGHITIANAAADGTTKGIAAFNSTNFTAAAGVVNTVQGIATTSAPTFAGLTLSAALSVANGGTGLSSLTADGILYASSTSAVSQLGVGSSGQCLISNGAGVTPTFQLCPGASGSSVTTSGGTNGTLAMFTSSNNIANSIITQATTTITIAGTLDLSNALTVANGGTGLAVLTQNELLYASSPSAVSQLGYGTLNQCLTSNGSGNAPIWQTCPGASGSGVSSLDSLTGNLTISNTTGSVNTITIDNAAADGVTKGIAAFNSTNFKDNGAGVINTVQNIDSTASPAFNALSLSNALTLGNGGTGSTSAAGARTNLSAAKSGVNSDITSLTGLTTALSVSQGGTGLGALTTYGILYADSTSTINQLGLGTSGQCLTSNGTGAAPTWQTCAGAGGVSSLDSLTGAITLANSSGSLGTITIDNAKADGATKGIAAFNSTNFMDNGSGVINTIQGIATTSTPTFAGLNLTAALTVGNGGTGSTSAAGARTNLSAAKNGANSDITQLTGLTTALSVSQGGTGLAAFTANELLYASSTSAIGQLAIGTSGQCLLSNGAGLAPSFQTCTGAGGVSSLDTLTGSITLDNSSGAAGHVTINNAAADGSTKGIAAFNSTNFTAASGVINTVQNIAITSAPTFGQLSLSSSQAASTMFTVNNTNALATGNLLDLQLNGSSKFSVNPAGNLTLNGTVNGQTIGSTSSFTGGVNVAGTLGVNTISPTGALTVGVGGQSFTLQGNTSSAIKSTNGTSTTTVDFQNPTANVTYNFATAVAGSYDICTTVGNCAGVGGGVTTPGGTANTLAKFTASGTIGNSIITDNGSTVSIGGTLAVNTITPTSALTVGATGQNLTLQGAAVTLSDTASGVTNSLVFATPSSGNKTITLPNASGTVAVSATGPIALDASGNLTCPTCLTTGGSGGTSGVSSVNNASGALTLQGSSAGSISTVGTVITINDASSSTKGLASFNATDLTVTAGNVDTVQSIAVTASPQFAGLTLSSALTVGNGGTGSTSAAGARTNLGAAKSGANSDITSLTGLTTALSVSQGGTGLTALTADGILYASSTSAVSQLAIGTSGQCLLSNGAGLAPTWQSCPGTGGVSSVDGLTGAITLDNSSGSAGHITIANAAADGSTKGIAAFNSTNFTAASGVINTIQGIATSSTPTFAGLSLTAALTVGNGGTGSTTAAGARANLGAAASGANSDITSLSGLTTALSVSQGGTGLTAFTANQLLYASSTSAISQISSGTSGQCLTSNGTSSAPTWQTCAGAGGVSSVNGLTGSITIDNASAGAGHITIANAAADGATKGIAAFNSTNFTAASGVINTVQNINTGASPTFANLTVSTTLNANTITPSSSMTIGASTQSFTLQGTAASTITSTGGGFTTTLGFTGVPTASQTYQFDRTAAAGTYTICTSIGNCAGAGGGVTTAGGTTNKLAVFTSSGSIGNSDITDVGGTSVTLGSGVSFNTAGAAQFKNASNTATAFQIQNSTGANFLNMDTLNNQIAIGNAASTAPTAIQEWDNNGIGLTTLPITTHTTGNLLMLAVGLTSKTNTVTAVSGGGVTSWHQVTSFNASVSRTELWEGTVTSTGAKTITVTYNVAPGNTDELSAQEFTAGLGSNTQWSVTNSAGDTNTGTTTVTFPSLTAAQSGELYWGYEFLGSAYSSGSTAGFTYVQTLDHNVLTYNPNTGNGSNYTPTALQALNVNSTGTAAIISASLGTSLSINSGTTVGGTTSSTAFQVQNAASQNLFAVDTSNNIVNIGPTGTAALASTINIATSTGASQTIHIGDTSGETSTITIGSNTSTSPTTIQGAGISTTVTGSGSAPSFVVKTSTASSGAFQVQNASGTIFNVDTSGKIVTVNSTGTPLVLNMTASGDENGILYETSGSPTGEIGVSGAASQIITQAAANDLSIKSVSGNILLAAGGTNAEVKIDTNGNTTFQNVVDSGSNSFMVKNQAGINLIGVNTSGATVNIGATGSDVLASTVNVGTSAGTSQTVTVGSNVSASTTTIQGGSGGVLITTSSGNTVNIGTSVSDNINIGFSSGTNPIKLQGSGITQTITGAASNPSDVIKTTTNSVNAFQVQNTSGYSILNVDTSGNTITLGNKTASAGQGVAGALALADGTNDNRAVTINPATLSNSYTLSLPATGGSGTQCLQSTSGSTTTATTLTFGSCSGGSGTTTLQQAYTNSAGASPSIDMTSTNKGFTVQNDNTSPITGELFGVHDKTSSGLGATLFSVANTGDVTANSNETTGSAFTYSANSVTSGNGLNVNANGLTTGYGVNIATTSALQTAGSLLNISDTASLTTNGGSLSGSLINVNRSLTANVAASALTPTLDTGQEVNAPNGGINGSRHNFFTVGNNPNRFLIVGVTDLNCQTPASLTYAGVSFTLIGQNTSNGTGCSYYYGLLAPATGTNDLLYTTSGTDTFEYVVSSWYNVSQSTPYGSFSTNFSNSGSSAALSATSTSGQTVVDFLGGPTTGNGTLATPTGTLVAYQNSNSVGVTLEGGTSYKPAAGASTLMGWNFLPASKWSESAIGLNGIVTAGVESVTSPVASFSNNCSLTLGSCFDSSSVLSVNQQYSGATGAALLVQNSGTGVALAVQNGSGTNLMRADTNAGQVVLGQSGSLNGALAFDDSSDGNTISIGTNSSGTLNITVPGGSGTDYFGLNNTSNSSTDNTDTGLFACTLFTAGQNGTVTSVSAYYTNVVFGDLAQAAIYTNSSGNPGSRLAFSNSVALNTANTWNTFPLSNGSAPVTAGTSYWLCTASNGNSSNANIDNLAFSSDGSTNQSRDYTMATYGTWPGSLSSPITSENGQYDMYASYTTTGSTTAAVSVSNSGGVTLKNAADSTTAFNIQDASGNQLFDVDSANKAINVSDAYLNVNGISNPQSPTLTTSGSGGSLTSGFYYYALDAVDPYGNTTGSVAAQTSGGTGYEHITSGTTNKNTLTWTTVTGAAGYEVWRAESATQNCMNSENTCNWYHVSVSSGTTTYSDTTNSTWTSSNQGSPAWWGDNSTTGINLTSGSQINFDGGASGSGQVVIGLKTPQGLGQGGDSDLLIGNFAPTGSVIANATTFEFDNTVDYTEDLRVDNTGGYFRSASNNTDAFDVLDSNFDTALSVNTNNVTESGSSAVGILKLGKNSVSNNSIVAAGAILSGQGDYAEYFTQATPDGTQPGDVVCLSANSTVEECGKNPADTLLGVVSTAPGYVGNNDLADSEGTHNTALVSMLGQVPVHVSDANGAIHVGDMLTYDPATGLAVKATGASMTIGEALQDFSGGTGTIQLYIHIGYYDPMGLQSDGVSNGYVLQGANATLSNLTVSGTATISTLSVTGSATIANLTVTTALSTAGITINGHIVTAGATPTFTAGTAAGTGANVTVTGNDESGKITVTIGSNTSAGELAKVTFSQVYGAAPNVILNAGDSNAAQLQQYVTPTDTGFSVNAATTNGLTTGQTYTFYYHVMQ